MGYDRKYNASQGSGFGPDNVLGDDLNYERTTGASSRAGRVVASHFRIIDGIPFGNRAWSELKRASDTPTNRELFKRYCIEALKPLVDNGDISDLSVETGDPQGRSGLAIKISFYDKREGDTATIGVIPPWGIEGTV